MIELLDTFVRLIAVGASLLLLTLLIAGDVRRPIKITLIGLLVGAVAYLFNSSPAFREIAPVLSFVDLASLFIPFWMWLFARRLFEREPRAGLLWAIVAAMVACWFAGTWLEWTRPWGFYIIHVIGLVLVADLIRVALAGRDDDLIEKRRTIRLWFPLLVAAQAGGILVFEMIIGNAIVIPAVQLVNALLILALTLFAGLALLKTDATLLAPIKSSAEPAGETARDALTASEKVLSTNLCAAMEEGFYRTPGLTIAGLAEHLGVPEHRLRALINQRLGYRNFSAFLNRHRIGEARAILADSAQVDVPVLTIAMDLGYNSLATFNRAFRGETGTNPTQFRQKSLG